MKIDLRHAVACAVLSAVSACPAYASEGSAKLSPPDRRVTCTHEAHGLKGAEHDDFMTWCLKHDTPVATQAKASEPGSQQDKMRKCNAEAKEKALKGDERHSYMSACLRG